MYESAMNPVIKFMNAKCDRACMSQLLLLLSHGGFSFFTLFTSLKCLKFSKICEHLCCLIFFFFCFCFFDILLI